MENVLHRMRDYAWPDFSGFQSDDLSRHLRWSLAVFIPLLAYYSASAVFVAHVSGKPWLAIVYAPHVLLLVAFILLVSFLGTRVGGCLLELVAIVWFKLSFWQMFLGADTLRLVVATVFLWYSTNLARACFALANSRYSARW